MVKTLEVELSIDGRSTVLKARDKERMTLSTLPPSATYQEVARLAAGRPFTAVQMVAEPFAGVATIPADVNLAESRVCLELDVLAPEEAAAVTVNGQPAGGFIGRPFRLDVTKLLKPGDNQIGIAPFAPKSAKLRVFGR